MQIKEKVNELLIENKELSFTTLCQTWNSIAQIIQQKFFKINPSILQHCEYISGNHWYMAEGKLFGWRNYLDFWVFLFINGSFRYYGKGEYPPAGYLFTYFILTHECWAFSSIVFSSFLFVNCRTLVPHLSDACFTVVEQVFDSWQTIKMC